MNDPMMDPMYRAALARGLMRLALDFGAVRAEVDSRACEPFDCGRSLADFERAAMDTLSLDSEAVRRAFVSLATRLDRDLSDVEPHEDVSV